MSPVPPDYMIYGPGPDERAEIGPVCAECRHLYVVHKSDAWYRWLCVQAPRPAEFNPVTGDTVADPPYARCREINRNGDCPMFDRAPVPHEWRRDYAPSRE